MKMTVKQKEKLIRILEVLKSQHCVKSYSIGCEEISSVVPEWTEGGEDRVFEAVLHDERPFGLKKTDRGWLAALLPEARRGQIVEVMMAKAKESVLQIRNAMVMNFVDRQRKR
jgi:hypothetical protein